MSQKVLYLYLRLWVSLLSTELNRLNEELIRSTIPPEKVRVWRTSADLAVRISRAMRGTPPNENDDPELWEWADQYPDTHPELEKLYDIVMKMNEDVGELAEAVGEVVTSPSPWQGGAS